MGASHTIKVFQAAGIEASRGVEANALPADQFVLVTDENDPLFCPGVNDEPSDALIQSLRNGWQKGSIVICVNRGKKGGKPIPVVAEGRSRIKAVLKVNAEREQDGLDPIEPEFVFVTEEEAYEAMHLGNNRQERSPLFEARRWAQFKRISALKNGRTYLKDDETSDVRNAYAKLIKCSTARIKGWELMLEAHPEVLRMCDARELSAAAVKDIVKSTEFAKQPEAARMLIEMAKAKKEDREEQRKDEPQVTHVADDCAPSHDSTPPEPEARPARGTRSERTDRRAALGIETTRPVSAKKLAELSVELRKIDDPELVDPRVFLALILGETEFDGLPITDHPSMAEVVRSAKRAGIKVTK